MRQIHTSPKNDDEILEYIPKHVCVGWSANLSCQRERKHYNIQMYKNRYIY